MRYAKDKVFHNILLLVVAPSNPLRTCSQHDMMAVSDLNRARQGKNFSCEEERQLCRSFLGISQDPIQGNGQRSTAFWKLVAQHYRQHKPLGGEDRPAQSLETK
jgi:hypothetical protein